MSVKTTGKELKQFWELSEPWWPKDGFVDGDSYSVNGVVVGDSFEPSSCADTDQVTILSGVICSTHDPEDEGRTLETIFKRWRKSLTTITVMVEIHRESVEYLKEEVKKLGGKIVT